MSENYKYNKSSISIICNLDSEKTLFGYNGIGQLVSAGNASSTTAYANTGVYDTAGHLTSMKAGNNLTTTESWDVTKGLLNSYNWGISGTNSLTWNNRGNITAQTKNGISYTYSYDNKNQLKEEKKAGTQTALWTYDANGNRATEKNGNSVQSLVYYTKSELVKSDSKWKYTYDANGNMTYKGKNATTKTNGGLFEGWTFYATAGEVWKYEYDLCNRLVRVSHSTAGTNSLTQVTEYKYDFRDLMVCRTVGTGNSAVSEYFAYDTEGKVIYTEKGTEKHDYIYANGKLWCEIVTKGTAKSTYYHHTDHLGTTVCITNTSGAVVWECEKDAFGSVLSKTNSSFRPNFTGKFLDETIGLYYFNARWYNPETGRFITEDPARDGKNWYVYCRNNPLKYIDLLGKKTEDNNNATDKNNDKKLLKLNKITEGIAFINNPIKMFFIGSAKDGGWNISSRASNFAINMGFKKSNFNGLEMDEGSSKGAFRHALWQAMITSTFGDSMAKKVGWAHDPNIMGTLFSGPSDSLEKVDKYTDLMNNRIGQKIAIEHPFASYKKLANYVLEEYKENGLYTVSIGEDGKYYAQNTRLNESEYSKAKDNLKNLNNKGLRE